MAERSRHFLPYGPQNGDADWELGKPTGFNHLTESTFPSPFIPQEDSFPIQTPSAVEGPAQWLDTEFFTPISPTTTSAMPHRSSTSSTAQSPYPLTSQSGDIDDSINGAIEEDKRRRNTAASARFRMKKKEREADLERRAGQMTERCEELQRRIGALETENRWLRELITERSRNRGKRGGRGMALNNLGRGKGKPLTKKEKDLLNEEGEGDAELVGVEA